VPLVLEDDPAFTDALRTARPVPLLLDSDVALLRDTYVHFWGPYWLAGEALQAGESRTAHIRVPGSYTVRDGAIGVDGMMYVAGEVLHLERGEIAIAAYDKPARLLWGDQLKEPDMPPPQESYWTQF